MSLNTAEMNYNSEQLSSDRALSVSPLYAQISSPDFQPQRLAQTAELKPSAGLPELHLSDSGKEMPRLTLASDASNGAQAETHKMSSRIFSWGWKFDIKAADGTREGTVDQRLLHLHKTFEYDDAKGQKQSTGQERLLSWGTKIDVSDASGKPIGGIQEQVFKSLWHPYSVYSIVDAQGKEVAKSEKLEAFSTNFTLTNENGDKIATIHRPWLNLLRDNWTISINKPGEVDKRLLYLIPAYKTEADAERKAQEAAEAAEKAKQNSDSSKKSH